jgi:hypothetical protein
VAHPQAQPTDEIARYAPLYLDAFLERYGFTLAPHRPATVGDRWLEHESCGWRRYCAASLPVRIIFNLAAAHLSHQCEQADQDQ